MLVPWGNLNVRVVSEPTPFPVSWTPRRVGVNAFGYGGTNAHAILESTHSVVPGYNGHKFMRQPTERTPSPIINDLEAERPHLLLFSAHNRVTLENYITDISSTCPGVCINDLSYTLGTRRTKLDQRTFAVTRINTFLSDVNAASAAITSSPRGKSIPAFVFTGMKQYPL